MEKELERFFVRILITHVDGGEICYIYNREVLDSVLNLKRHTYDQPQFIEVGNILTIDGKKYEVKKINFKLDEKLHHMDNRYGINVYSPTEPTDFNGQLGVFVEKLD